MASIITPNNNYSSFMPNFNNSSRIDAINDFTGRNNFNYNEMNNSNNNFFKSYQMNYC